VKVCTSRACATCLCAGISRFGLHFTTRALPAYTRGPVSSYCWGQTSGCVQLRQSRLSLLSRPTSKNQGRACNTHSAAPSTRYVALHENKLCFRRCCVDRLWCSCWCTAISASRPQASNVRSRGGGSRRCPSCLVRCGYWWSGLQCGGASSRISTCQSRSCVRVLYACVCTTSTFCVQYMNNVLHEKAIKYAKKRKKSMIAN
jgi:hypothetical protein